MQALTKKQFDVLEALTTSKEKLNESDLAKASGCSPEEVKEVLNELVSLKYVNDYAVTNDGLNALEPYRVKRAVFIAAGFGARLLPITINTPKPLVRVNGVRIIDKLIDACLEADINEIYIVRGYLGEQFDQLLYKYPMIKFLDNPLYKEANNISSALIASHLLSNAYVFEADLLITNKRLVKKYHYTSDFLAIKKDVTDDWCFYVKDGVIIDEKLGGTDCWQLVGISYWDGNDGKKLEADIKDVYGMPDGKNSYWEQVPLVFRKEHYAVRISECYDEDITEIDTFDELKAIDKKYDV